MTIVQFVVVCVSYHDPIGKIVEICDDEQRAEDLRNKLDEQTPASYLSFFYVKELVVKE
jgi:hypothetical protein